MPPFKDMTGKKFGKLTAIKRIPSRGDGKIWYLFRCDCGVKLEIRGNSVRNGSTTSCGCAQAARARESNAIRATHGQTRGGVSPEYRAWVSMRQRCRNPKSKKYARYGGRGIRVCGRWDKFENFFADMGRRPRGMTVERIDNDKGYSPSNCVWADRFQQAKNKGNNVRITHSGQTKTMSDWARHFGMDPRLLQSRLRRYGMSFLRATSKLTPKQKNRKTR